MPDNNAFVLALLIWVIAIAAVDWRVRRVPNSLLLAVLLPAGAIYFWRDTGLLGISPVAGLIGLALGLMLALPGYLFSRLGAGDVKLAATLGFLQGRDGILLSLLLAALLLGMMSLAVLVRLGRESAAKVRLPAAVAIGGGFATALLVSRWGALA